MFEQCAKGKSFHIWSRLTWSSNPVVLKLLLGSWEPCKCWPGQGKKQQHDPQNSNAALGKGAFFTLALLSTGIQGCGEPPARLPKQQTTFKLQPTSGLTLANQKWAIIMGLPGVTYTCGCWRCQGRVYKKAAFPWAATWPWKWCCCLPLSLPLKGHKTVLPKVVGWIITSSLFQVTVGLQNPYKTLL